MHQLVHELYELSTNTPLFSYLRTGGNLTNLPGHFTQATDSSVTSPKKELLATFCDAMIVWMQSDDPSRLHSLIANIDISDRVTIVGELILILYALHEGKQADEKVDAILDQAFQLAHNVARDLEVVLSEESHDDEVLKHGIALREWAHLLAGYYHAAGSITESAEMLLVRARITNCSLNHWPNLVGPAMIDLALALESIGNLDMAIKCYGGVRADLQYLIDRVDDPALPEVEKIVALYWLQRACEEYCRLVPTDPDAPAELRRIWTLREERGFPDAVSAPRFGPIAETYLDRIPYLALIIRDLENSSESISAICQRYGCLSSDVDFYLSAIGSYSIRGTILRGIQTYYDDAHEEVFAAMEYLRTNDWL